MNRTVFGDLAACDARPSISNNVALAETDKEKRKKEGGDLSKR